MANLLPSFKTLLFWRNDRGNSDSEGPKIEALPKSDQVEYHVNDETISSRPITIDQQHSNDFGHRSDENSPMRMRSVEQHQNRQLDYHHHLPQSHSFHRIDPKMMTIVLNNRSGMLERPNHFTPAQSIASKQACYGCDQSSDLRIKLNDINDEYQQRIEFIKEQILNRLGLKEPPKLKVQPDFELINHCKALNSFL
ncbi:hypothetical protein QR98_0020720 [Sarcoptes scabiei]|uniref:Uncharacterized protein n=1 Tax=Sarcoptes scabiei TaxID=52283 RepID=A0A131ZYP8_SARSC|nr:hypothetical protein QR98_0020720 [Sarcoptes scabiei]